MNKMLSVILATIIALCLMTTACQSKQDSGQAPQVGKLAPTFQLPDLNGQNVSVQDLRGKPVLVNFWASWCGPCVYEMPYIQEVYDKWSGDGLVVLAINIGESLSQAREFMESSQLSFPVLLDKDGKVAEQYNVRGIPMSVFIDREGIIRAMKIGAFPSKAAIEENLRKIMP
jgi:cytochrome c biogenesis protein CcmG/thiol:disulfide interchange protein DsbE